MRHGWGDALSSLSRRSQNSSGSTFVSTSSCIRFRTLRSTAFGSLDDSSSRLARNLRHFSFTVSADGVRWGTACKQNSYVIIFESLKDWPKMENIVKWLTWVTTTQRSMNIINPASKWQVNKAIFLYDGTNDSDLAISSSDVMSALSNLINTDRVTLVWFLSSGKYRFMPLEWVQIVVLKTNPQEVHIFAARMCVDVVFSVVVVVMTLRW